MKSKRYLTVTLLFGISITILGGIYTTVVASNDTLNTILNNSVPMNITVAETSDTLNGSSTLAEDGLNATTSIDTYPYDESLDYLEYLASHELNIVKIRVRDENTRQYQDSAGALVDPSIVVTCCRCVFLRNKRCKTTRDRISNEIVQVFRGVTGEVRYVNDVSSSIRSRCYSNRMVNTEAGLILKKPYPDTPFHLELAEEDFSDVRCRFYSFRRLPGQWTQDQDISTVVVAPFLPHLCGGHNDTESEKVTCGTVRLKGRKFCDFTPGAVIICGGKLLGISQTSCNEGEEDDFRNRSEIVVIVSIVTPTAVQFWLKLAQLSVLPVSLASRPAMKMPTIVCSILSTFLIINLWIT